MHSKERFGRDFGSVGEGGSIPFLPAPPQNPVAAMIDPFSLVPAMEP